MKDVTRYIKPAVERELWARAAGRCEFNGCNRLLYKSLVTQESINAAQKAHIYSFSEKGPRGRGPYEENPKDINSPQNLMLVCHQCHQTIDPKDKTEKYSAELLQASKKSHEDRVRLVTGIDPDNKSHLVLYGANIGDEKSPLSFNQCATAMFPDHYPADDKPVILSMDSALKDDSADYWNSETSHLRSRFDRVIQPLIESDSCKHFSIFGFAPQPLLILLGTLFTDKIQVDSYQLHREPEPGWKWDDPPDNTGFKIIPPESFSHTPALLFSLSASITHDRISSVLGGDVSIWEITTETPHNDFMKSKRQISEFREAIRKLMAEIKQQHGDNTPLHIFPAMPVSCCIETGRTRMPKADMPWVIYDQNNKHGSFIETIRI